MLRGTLTWVLSIGLVCLVALSLIAGAAPAPSKPETPAPAPTVPAPTDSTPGLLSLLQASGLAYTQPDKTQPSYKVMVESSDGNTAIVVICDEIPAKWKYPDGGTVKWVHMYTPVTPFYTQDIEPSVKFMRAVLEQNNLNWFSFYTLDTNPNTGVWSLWADSYLFIRGATGDVFKDHLLLLASASDVGKQKFLPLMKAKSP